MAMGSSPVEYTFVAVSVVRKSKALYMTHFPIQVQLGVTGKKRVFRNVSIKKAISPNYLITKKVSND